MKKALIILGGIFAVILIMAVIFAAIFIPQAIRMDKNAISYLDANIPIVCSNWDTTELTKRASPELLKIADSEKLKGLFVMLSRLGKLKSHEDPVGSINTSSFTGEGTKTIGNYTIKCIFDAGDAVIKVQLIKSGEDWRINGFHINSEIFLSK